VSLLERFRPTTSVPLPQGARIGFRWGVLSSQRRTSLGVDIGAGTIKVAQIRWTRQGPRLENYAVVPTGAGRMEEGVLREPIEVGELLRTILAEMGVTQDRVGTSVGGPNILMRHINLPKVSPEEMRAAMKFEAPQHLPIPEDQLLYDFTPVPEATGIPEHLTAVFLAGTNKRLVEGVMASLTKAGVRPTHIELDCLTVLRTLQTLGLVSTASAAPLVLLDFGEVDTRLSIIRFGVPVLSRTIPTGLSHLRLAVADSLRISADEAEAALRLKGIREDADLESAVQPWLSGLMEAVGRSVEFFLIENRGAQLDRVFLVGGGATLPSLTESLNHYLGGVVAGQADAPNLRVQAVGLAGLDINPELLPDVNQYGPLLLGALGSAIREGSPE
jgi:type IV pilus assembly protein PilM